MKNLEDQVMADGYSLSVLTGETAFHELKDEWEELWRKSPDATHFQRWEWQYLYYKHIIPNAPLKIYVVRNSRGKCVALVAFCRVRDQYSGLFKVAFLGDLSADYHLILCGGNLPDSVGFLILDQLFEKSGLNASYIDLSNIPYGSWTERVLSAYFSNKPFLSKLIIQKKTQTYAVPLPKDLETYLGNLSRNTRKQLRSDRRRLQKEFAIAEWRTYDGVADLEQGLLAIEEVDRARWKQDSRYCDPKRRAFQVSLVRAQMSACIHLAFVLYLNHKPVSYLSGNVVQNSYKCDSTGHDPNAVEHLSVGRDINFYAIEVCIQHGISEFDLQRGAEEYKIHLGAQPHDNLHFRVYRGWIDQVLELIGEKVLEFLRKQNALRRLYQRFIRGQV